MGENTTLMAQPQNHEQHERRWAPGTFLAAFRTHVGNLAPFDYCLWLSLNPENDRTAIWVERKFDVPNSGVWASDRVFSILLAPHVASHSPGLVVFESSPLHGVDDEIEKCVCPKTETNALTWIASGNTEFWMTVLDYVK